MVSINFWSCRFTSHAVSLPCFPFCARLKFTVFKSPEWETMLLGCMNIETLGNFLPSGFNYVQIASASLARRLGVHLVVAPAIPAHECFLSMD